MREAGYAQVVGSAWNGIVAPAAVSKEIVQKLNLEIAKVLDLPETRDHFAAMGMEPGAVSPDAFARFLTRRIGKVGRRRESGQHQIGINRTQDRSLVRSTSNSATLFPVRNISRNAFRGCAKRARNQAPAKCRQARWPFRARRLVGRQPVGCMPTKFHDIR
jgi:hypothetical protein